MTYLLDSNVFIEAKNRYYAFDICPGFWSWMDAVVAGGDVLSISKVCDELCEGNDELATWAKARKGDGRFLDVSDANTQQAFAQIAGLVQAGNYTPAARATFLGRADPWLIAKAQITGATIVTHENLHPEARKTVPIPNICTAVGVRYVNTFDLLRELTASFILDVA